MVVLSEDGNEYEVRVRRAPQGTYFDERIKFGDPWETKDLTADRYIVAEPGQEYAVEVIVKKGMKWGPYKQISATMFFVNGEEAVAGYFLDRKDEEETTTEDHILTFACVNYAPLGTNLIGAPFTFQNLAIGTSPLATSSIV